MKDDFDMRLLLIAKVLHVLFFGYWLSLFLAGE